MATPLIQPIRTSGGTIYTFTSAIRDLQKTFSDDDIRFRFSKFALLNLPDVKTPGNTFDNSIVWDAVTPIGEVIDSVNDKEFAESFQNYLLNQEEFILESNDYDHNQRQSISERLFWKWLAKINVIKFDSATTESNIQNRFKEQSEINGYNSVVQYLGDIDVMNNTERYSEVYINIPTNHGKTPHVLFKTISDVNYPEGKTWSSVNEYINGREFGDNHPYNLSTKAYYDNNSTNSYLSGPTFGLTSNTLLYAPIGSTSGTPGAKSFNRSNMDGVVLDFDYQNYKLLTQNSLTSLNQFAASDWSSDFKFNAILLYYSIKKGDELEVTNLYGVLVLDNFIQTATGGYIPRYEKIKPNNITKLNGNSYAFKLNIRFNSSASNLSVEKLINPESNIGMDIFIDASSKMKEAADLFIDTKLELNSIRKRLDSIESFFYSTDDLQEIRLKIDNLESYLINNQIALQNKDSLIELVNTNANNITALINGQLSPELSFNLDLIHNGSGIEIDRSVKNLIKITNTATGYNVNMNSLSSISPNTDNVLFLNRGLNYFREKSQLDLVSDLNIEINTDIVKWIKGDSVKLIFDHLTTNKTIFIKTEGVIITNIIPSDLISNSPIIEIICLDENSLNFDINILR